MLTPPTKAKRPSGPHDTSLAYAGGAPDRVTWVGVPATALDAIVNRWPPLDITSFVPSGDQSGEDSATDVAVTCTGPVDPFTGTT